MMTGDVAESSSERERLFAAFPAVSAEAWEAQVREDLSEADVEARLRWHPLEDIEVQASYRAADLEALAHWSPETNAASHAFPRRPPLLRQDVYVTDAGVANAHARTALAQGAEALGFVLSATDALVIQDQAGLERLLRGLPLAETPLSLEAGMSSPALLLLLLNEATRQGIDPARLQGMLGYDPLGALAQTGRSWDASVFDDLVRLFRYGTRHAPGIRPLLVSAVPFHDAGASATQELGLLLATLSEYLAGLGAQGLEPAATAAGLHLGVPVGTSYFVEIAKLRGLPLLYGQVMEAYLPAGTSLPRPYIQATTSRRGMTVYDPYVNLLRGTTEAAAALAGGCDALAVQPFDAAFSIPDAFSYRLARNTGLVLRHEAGFDRVTDPAAGSYYLEVLTDKIGRTAWSFFQQIEAEGGLREALRSGFIQRALRDTRKKRQEQLALRKRVLVGVNQYPDAAETRLDEMDITAPLRTLQAPPGIPFQAPLETLRANLAAGGRLTDLLAPGAPAAEIPVEALPAERAAGPFEALRLRTERYARARGSAPVVFLLPFGDRVKRTQRAAFAGNFFGCGGFHVVENAGFEPAEAGARAAIDAQADVVVLCSADDAYAAATPRIAAQLNAGGSTPLLVLAGLPDEQEALRTAGVEAFIHLCTNLLEALSAVQDRLGMPDS